MGLSKRSINHTKVGAENLQPLHMVRSKYFLDSSMKGVVKNMLKPEVVDRVIVYKQGYFQFSGRGYKK
jgi:hypothetical protein